jgi:hypothetical protein
LKTKPSFRTCRTEHPVCPIPVQQDFKDIFYVGQSDGWRSISIPNDRERETYEVTSLKGLVLICHASCDWGNCPGGDIREDGVTNGKLKMKVNGIMANNVTMIDSCYFLRHEGGYYFPVIDGRIEIKAKPIEATSFVRFSTMVVW